MENSTFVSFVSGLIFGIVITYFAFAASAESTANKIETARIEINWINSSKEASANVLFSEPADNALPVRITPILSAYNDCNKNPGKYDIYGGNLTVDAEPCRKGNDWNGDNCYVKKITLYGSSMSPTIKNHDNIYIKYDSQYDLKYDYSQSAQLQNNQSHNFSVGTIIAYDSLGQIAGEYSKNTIHRIVGINSGNAEAVYFEGNTKYAIAVPDGVNEIIITRFGKNYTLKRPFYVVKGDNNSVCEVVASNMVHGVLAGVAE